MLRAVVVAVLLLPIFPAQGVGPVPPDFRAKIDPALPDLDFLQREAYLSGNTVQVIVMLDTEDALKTTHREFQAKKQQAVNVLKAIGLPFTLKLDLKIIDGFSANVDLGSLNALVASGDVKKVWLDLRGRQLQADVLTLTHTNTTPGAWTYGVGCCTGSGVNITQIDNGFNYTQSELGGCSQPISNCAKIPDHWDFIDSDSDVFGGNGHGTKTAILTAGATYGVAKDAKLFLYRADTTSRFVAAIERAVDNGTNIISISWDIGSDEEDGALLTAINNAYDSGVLTFASAGNGGPNSQSIAAPAVGRNVIAVGSTYDNDFSSVSNQGDNYCSENNVKKNQMGCWSSRGPTNDGRTKPDLVSPGYKVQIPNDPNGDAGTSWSAPIAAGVAALIVDQNPSWTPSQIKDKIMNSSVDLNWFNASWNYGPNEQGAGRVDAYNALDDSPPTVQLTLPTYSTSSSVPLSYSCVDDNLAGDAGERRVRFRNEDGAWSGWTWHRRLGDPQTDVGSLGWDLSAGQGRKTVHFECKDLGGNVATKTATVFVDIAPPVTSFDLTPELNENGWTNIPLTVTLSADDTNGLSPDQVSGVQSIQFSLDGSPFETYVSSFDVSAEGEHAVRASATDNAGNIEATRTQPIRIDTTLPETQASVEPPEPDGNQGWYITIPTISLSASDSLSGIANLTYRWNSNPATVTTQPTAETQPPGDGEHELRYHAADRADNVQADDSIELKMDATPPDLQITRPLEDHLYVANHDLGPNLLTNDTLILGDFTFEALASDTASGLAKVTFYLDGEEVASFNESPLNWTWQSYLWRPGSHVFGVEAVDLAGNVAYNTMSVANGLNLGVTLTAEASLSQPRP